LSTVYRARIAALCAQMNSKNIDTVIATSPASFYYFTGIWLLTGERASSLVIRKNGQAAWIVHKMFEHEVSVADVPVTFWADGESAYPLISKLISSDSVVAIDGLWQARHVIGLMNTLPEQVQIVNADNLFALIRSQKGDEELGIMAKSSALADEVVMKFKPFLRPGRTELEVTHDLEALWQESLADGLSFPAIVASGVNGASPHHEPDESQLVAGSTVIVDTGGILGHYCSDTTRTFILGEPTEEIKKVYECVQKAQLAGIEAAKPGVTLGDVDKATRKVIEDAGYGEYFTHRTGHGVGLEIHEAPYVVQNNPDVLDVGMVITVEPGIYLPGKFGVRIEDTVVVEKTGGRSLNQSPKGIQDMVISI
jgi:Xaa-Pro dipeptidase